ncbi:hypothetical protein K435DRAFT_707506, partial [Dendrothele bispora CBS 962.96]
QLAELCLPDVRKHQNLRKRTRRDSVKWYLQGYGFDLPQHKADPFFEGNKVVIRRHARFPTEINPYNPFLDYIKSCDNLFPTHWQLWLQADGSMPTRSWFIGRLKSLYNRQDIAGQSIRSGGATGLAEIGVPLHLIRATGHWASETFHIYIRKNPTFLTALLLQ